MHGGNSILIPPGIPVYFSKLRPEPLFESLQIPLLSIRMAIRRYRLKENYYSRVAKMVSHYSQARLEPDVCIFIKLKNTLDRSVQLVEP